MQKPNEPIWFNDDKTVTPNNDTYQTIKKNKVESTQNYTEINIGGQSPHRIMLCTPCHSDVSMHYCQAVLKFQQECWQKKLQVSFTLLKSSWFCIASSFSFNLLHDLSQLNIFIG